MRGKGTHHFASVAKLFIRAQARGIFAKGSIIGIVVFLIGNRMSPNKNEEFPDFSPAEIEAMRYAYRQMLEGFPNRLISESEKRELARSILEALGRTVSREGELKVLKLVHNDNH